jgi:SAM-dependent methyltransferase
MPSYDQNFYKSLMDNAKPSAEQIVPLVLQLLEVHSVIDVGCGVGTWLSVFREHGVADLFGLDGDWVDKRLLQIPPDCFMAVDLKAPINFDRQFDLVVSLEVAEHLPKERAESFVNDLTKLGPVILFSAAIPTQGGVNHVNEQWPEYWANYFSKKNFVAVDCIRKCVWNNARVAIWYAQNILLFVKKDVLEKNEPLKSAFNSTALTQLSIIHPYFFVEKSDPKNMHVASLLSALPVAVGRDFKRLKRRIANHLR